MTLRPIKEFLGDVRLLGGVVALLLGGGFYAYGQVREIARSEAETVTRPIAEIVKALSSDLEHHRQEDEDLRKDIGDLRDDLRNTREEIRNSRSRPGH